MPLPNFTQNQPIGYSVGYQPGVVSSPYNPQQTGYRPGAPQTYFPGTYNLKRCFEILNETLG